MSKFAPRVRKKRITLENRVTEINGIQLYNCFVAGAQKILDNQALLNKINVFPVADADTGSNMASTMLSIVNNVNPQDNVKQTISSIADAALTGARGNSGIIFAQYLYGFSQEIGDVALLTVKNFAESMQRAVKYAYDAIANPQEGTIISVIKDWADCVYDMKDSYDEFIDLLLNAFGKATESLKSTAKWIATKAKYIVDAGAKGFVVFLEGMMEYFKSGLQAVTINNAEIISSEELDTFDHQNITFRYCTEALLSGENLSKEVIYNMINDLGDSLVVAGSPTKMRLHIHTDEPWTVMDRIQKIGNTIYQKVEDMVMQNDIVSNKKSNIGILTDSTCDLPEELLNKHQIQVVPLSIHFGEELYLDHLTIKLKTFIEKLYSYPELPTSAQPSLNEFINKYNYLTSHYDSVISSHIMERLSNTINGSRKAAEKVSEKTGKKISVVDTNSASSSLGLMLVRAAECIEQGMSHDEVVEKLKLWTQNSKMWVCCNTVKYAFKSGRLSNFKSFLVKCLGVMPTITIKPDGKPTLSDVSFSSKKSYKNTLDSFRKFVKGKKVWNYAITHADNMEAALYLQDKVKEMTGKEALYITEVSPMLTGKVGPKTISISVILE